MLFEFGTKLVENDAKGTLLCDSLIPDVREIQEVLTRDVSKLVELELDAVVKSLEALDSADQIEDLPPFRMRLVMHDARKLIVSVGRAFVSTHGPQMRKAGLISSARESIDKTGELCYGLVRSCCGCDRDRKIGARQGLG